MGWMPATKTAAAILAVGAILAFGLGATPAQADGPTTIDDVLTRWEKQAAERKTISVSVTRTDKSKAWPNVERYQGHLIFKDADNASVHLQKVGAGPNDGRRLIFTPTEIREYDQAAQQIFVFPRVKGDPSSLANLMSLPFLLGRKAAGWKELYKISLAKENATAYLLKIEPRGEAKPAAGRGGDFLSLADFRDAYLQLNKETLLPERFVIVAPDGKQTQDYALSGIRLNEPVSEVFFKPLEPKGWTVRRNPLQWLIQPAKQ
jgi:outer membrane lipoprotein-sorting protein